MRRLLSTVLLCTALSAQAGSLESIVAVQQAQLKQLKQEKPEYDLLKIWSASRQANNVWNPADGGSLEAVFEGGTVTPTNPVGSHHVLIGKLDLPEGNYRLDLTVIPSNDNHGWIWSGADKNKTLGFYARVGSLSNNISGLNTADYVSTTTASFNGTSMTSPGIATVLTFSSATARLSGRQEIWVGFNPYAGHKKLSIVNAVLRRVN